MKDSKDRYDEYRQSINSALSGGGCAEAWSATESTRTASRRQFVAATAVLASSLTSLTGVAAASDDEQTPDDITVTELKGEEKEAVLSTALADPETDRLLDEILKSGQLPGSQADTERSPAVESASVYKTETGDITYETAFIKLDQSYSGFDWEQDSVTEESDSRVSLAWSTRAERPTSAVRFTYIPEGTDTSSKEYEVHIEELIVDDSTAEEQVESTETILTQRDLDEFKRQLDDTDDEVSPQAVFGPCGPCPPDMDCVYELADAYASSIIVCSTCAASRDIGTCASCIAVIIDNDDFGTYCDPCPYDSWFC